jgi:hypothetical protein
MSKDQQIETLNARIEELEMKLQSKESDLEALEFIKDELAVKVIGLEEKVTVHKQTILTLERKLVELECQSDFI